MTFAPVSHRVRRRIALPVGFLAALGLFSCHSRETGQRHTSVRIAVPDSGFSYLPVFMAKELGFYGDQGLDVTLDAVYGGGSKSMQAILGRSVEVGGISLELGIQLAAEGRHVQSFVTLIDRPSYVLALSPASKRRIHTVNDLKGAVIGISSPGSGSHNFANYVLVTHEVPIASVSFVGIGLGAPAIAAFEHGQIDAAVLMGNAITGIERRSPGVGILADTRTIAGVKAVFGTDVYPAQGLAASPEWLQRNPATARKVARALLQTIRFMREHSADEIRPRMPAQFRSSDAEADLKALHEIVPLLSQDGKITPEGARAVKKVLDVSSEKVRLASINLPQTYTNAFVRSQ